LADRSIGHHLLVHGGDHAFLDTKGGIRGQSFSGSDADWDSFRLKFEAYTDLLGIGGYMDAAENEINRIGNATPSNQDAVNCSKALYALLIVKCEGNALGILTLVPQRYRLEAWRLLDGEYEGKQGSRIAAMLREILYPGGKWQQGHNEGKDVIEVLTAWEHDVSKYRIASGEDISDNVLVATVLERAPVLHRDAFGLMPQISRDNYAGLRRYIREWCVVQRSYDARRNQAASAIGGAPPMKVDQMKGDGKSGRQERKRRPQRRQVR
jgi:hypothetical protein